MFCIFFIPWIVLPFQIWVGKQHSVLYLLFYQACKKYIKEVEKDHKELIWVSSAFTVMRMSYDNFLHKTFLPFLKRICVLLLKINCVSTPAENNREARSTKSDVTNCDINK